MEAVIPGTSREMEAVIPGTSSADAKSPGTRIHEYCQMDQGYQPLYLPQSQYSESWAALLPPRPVRSIAEFVLTEAGCWTTAALLVSQPRS